MILADLFVLTATRWHHRESALSRGWGNWDAGLTPSQKPKQRVNRC